VPWTCRLTTAEPGFSERPVLDAIRSVLKYNDGRQAEWRDATNHRWQPYYLRWLPIRNRYRAAAVWHCLAAFPWDIFLSAAAKTNSGRVLVKTRKGRSCLHPLSRDHILDPPASAGKTAP